MNDEGLRLAWLKANLERRAQVFEHTRSFFYQRGFLEVDTPVRVPAVAPEQYITPHTSEDWFLITSPELHMKRLLSAGYERIFELSHCFRKGERGRLHNPEFTLLEWYRAGGNYLDMIIDTEQLVVYLTQALGMKLVISYQGQEIDLTPPWPRLTVSQAFKRFADWDPLSDFDPLRFDDDIASKVIPAFPTDIPLILTGYPAQVASLARINADDQRVAERAEVFIGGLELANAYSELNDAAEQKRRFEAECDQIEREKGYRPPLPQAFLDSVGYMPACGGIALGMERLLMILCDAENIDEVLAFTADTA
jgi:lysyl-tRNA synthetase class 2